MRTIRGAQKSLKEYGYTSDLSVKDWLRMRNIRFTTPTLHQQKLTGEQTMVNRTENSGITTFIGTVEDVVKESSTLNTSDGEQEVTQYHMTIIPHDIEMKGDTGRFHEWIRLSGKSTETDVQVDSAMDKYLQVVEHVEPKAKDASDVTSALLCLKGQKYVFEKKPFGRRFAGFSPKDMWYPVKKA